MGITKAGTRLCVPRWVGWVMAVSAPVLAAAGTCRGAATDPAGDLFQDHPLFLQDAATETTTAPTTITTTEPATEPAGFLPAPPPARVQTSNGGDLLPQGELIQVNQPRRGPVQFSFTGLYMYGSVKGNVQATHGGKIGTSNADRPQFHSIGINYANIGDLELDATVENAGEFFAGAQIIQLNGAAFIGPKTLTTNGVVFPAHAFVSSNIGLDWYRIGWRYTLPLTTAQNGIPELTFAPFVDAVIWDFNYHLTAARVAPASRALTKAGVQIGAVFAWRPNGGPLSLEASLAGFPIVADLPTISQESLYLRYRFYQWRRFDFTGLLGVAFEQQEFRNSSPLPDHVSADFGPMLMAGLQFQF